MVGIVSKVVIGLLINLLMVVDERIHMMVVEEGIQVMVQLWTGG